MSRFASKTTDGQSNGRRPGGWHAQHVSRATGLLLTLADLVHGRGPAGPPRGPAGENPWGHPVTPAGARRVFACSGVVDAAPADIFPLLCPVLEYEWIDDWTCTMEYTESGAAEEGCAFRTRARLGERWLCTRYEPPDAIRYVVWLRVGWLVLDATLHPRDDGTTEVRWRRTFTATTPLGRKMIAGLTDDGVRREMEALQRQLATHVGKTRGARAAASA